MKNAIITLTTVFLFLCGVSVTHAETPILERLNLTISKNKGVRHGMPERQAKIRSGQTEADTGRYQRNGEENVVMVPDGTDDTTICSYKSPAGNCYRFSVNDGLPGAPVVVLTNRDTFDNFLDYYEGKENMDWCEVVANPWSGWTRQGSVPTACGIQSFNEVRTCSTGSATRACSDTCPVSSETRSVQVNNGPCCTATSWSPNTNTQPLGTRFTQTSNCSTTRSATGSFVPIAKPTVNLSFSPSSIAYGGGSLLALSTSGHITSCSGSALGNTTLGSKSYSNQTSNMTATHACSGPGGTTNASASLTVAAAPVCVDTTWTPNSNSCPIGQTFTQTSNCDHTQKAICTDPIAKPTVSLSISPSSIAYGGSTSLNLSTGGNISVCSGTFGNIRSKNQVYNNLTSSTSVSHSCTGLGGTTNASASLSVAAAACVDTTWSPYGNPHGSVVNGKLVNPTGVFSREGVHSQSSNCDNTRTFKCIYIAPGAHTAGIGIVCFPS